MKDRQELAKRAGRLEREANAGISGESRGAGESSQDMKERLCRTGIIPPPLGSPYNERDRAGEERRGVDGNGGKRGQSGE